MKKRRGRLQNRMLYETHAVMRFIPEEKPSEDFARRWEETFGKKDEKPTQDAEKQP